MSKPQNIAANAVAGELQELANILMTRCAKLAAEKAQIQQALTESLSENEALKKAVAMLESGNAQTKGVA